MVKRIYSMAQEGHSVLAYLDDYASCHASYHQASEGFNKFLALAKELGLDLALHKSVSPTNIIDWLGYSIDSDKMIVTIPAAKLQEFVKYCSTWVSKRHASKCSIQSLVGKMSFISNCVTQGRRFMSRVLAALRAMGDQEWTTLSEDFRLDVKWFITYAEIANGVALFVPNRLEVQLEARLLLLPLTGGGGVGLNCCYTWLYT